MPAQKEIAIVLDPTSARRLLPSMLARFKADKAFWIFDSLRPAEEIFRQVRKVKPDGIIMRIQPETNRALLRLRKPTVICGGNRVAPMVCSVSSDGDKVGEVAARHLLDLGLRNLAFFGIEAPFSPPRQRGFIAAVRAARLTCETYVDPRDGWEHYMELMHTEDDALARWLHALPKPVGIFAAHDPLGWHLSLVCRKAGLAVPEKVAIVSANNDELVCHLASPPLSSVSVPWERVGAEIALALDRMLEAVDNGRAPELQGQLVRVPPVGIVTRQSSNILAVKSEHLRRALSFIQQHADKPFTVEGILQHVNVSRRKLENDFLRELGRTPREEITRVRVERAKHLLAETDLPVPLVAERCGYNYTERFTVAFRRTAGVTPMAFRKSMRAVNRA